LSCGAGEPAGEDQDVLGELRRVEHLELGADQGDVDREHVEGFGAGVQGAGVFAIGFELADGGRDAFGDAAAERQDCQSRLAILPPRQRPGRRASGKTGPWMPNHDPSR
jgi:hypothetical protein